MQRLYLRSHPNDARRISPADPTNPTSSSEPVWPWYISPDIRAALTTDPEPWASGAPTEADFTEREEPIGAFVRATPDPLAPFVTTQVPLVPPLGNYVAAMWVGEDVYRIHVLVHYRDSTAVPADDVRVGVFLQPVPDTVSEWEALTASGLFLDAVTDLLTAAVPPSWPGGLGWEPIDPANPRLSPRDSVDARTPRVVTFDLDFRGAASGSYMLLAVASAATDHVSPVSLSGDPGTTNVTLTVKDLVLNSHHVGVRVVKKF